MRLARIRTLFVLSALAAGTSIAAGPATAQTPYDGLWQVTVVTKTGSCDARSTSTVTVTDGWRSAISVANSSPRSHISANPGCA